MFSVLAAFTGVFSVFLLCKSNIINQNIKMTIKEKYIVRCNKMHVDNIGFALLGGGGGCCYSRRSLFWSIGQFLSTFSLYT